MQAKVQNTIVELKQGDITEQDTDAIVNAANTQLILGGGVAGAIRTKGGPAIQAECNQKGPISVGQAVLTTAGNLKAKYVIHAAGPRAGEGQEDVKLKNAAINCLKLADAHNLKSISFCAISTGIFGFPMDLCAEIMLRETLNYLYEPTQLEKVVFCLFSQNAYKVFAAELARLSANSEIRMQN